ncbi:MAG: hypothetical protein JXA30_02460 [Deltaproteobacteria bacterium]|nr:hypothetical protein [Deltaproteobacteria bacterium]
MKRNQLPTKPVERSVVSWGFCLGNLTIAMLMLLIVFFVLPVRWWPVDLSTVALATVFGLSAFGLAAQTSWKLVVLKISAFVCLVIGLSVIAAIGLSAAFLIGIHGSLGKNGALIMAFVIALLFTLPNRLPMCAAALAPPAIVPQRKDREPASNRNAIVGVHCCTRTCLFTGLRTSCSRSD